MPSILQKPQNKKNKVHYQKRKTAVFKKRTIRSKYNEIINNLIKNGSNTPRTLF